MTTPESDSDRQARHERIEAGAERFKQATTRTVERAREAVDHAADRVEQGMHRATDRTADATERASDRVARAEARGREAVDDTVQHAQDWYRQGLDFVSRRPLQSVAIAVAAGWLVGRLTRR